MIFQDFIDITNHNNFIKAFPAVSKLMEENGEIDINKLPENHPFRILLSSYKERINSDLNPELRRSSTNIFSKMLYDIDRFHPFLVSVEQIIEFLHAKIDVSNIDYLLKMNMPFEELFIDFNGTLFLEDEHIKALIISRSEKGYNGKRDFIINCITKRMHNLISKDLPKINRSIWSDDISWSDEYLDKYGDQVLQGYQLINSMESTMPVMLFAFRDPNDQVFSNFKRDESLLNFQEKLLKIAIGFCLYVNSVNVEIIKVDGESLQTKKRKSQGKPIPEPYYFCKLERKEIHREKSENGDGNKHGFQYDVRGHFAHYRNTFRGKPVNEYSRYNSETKSITLWIPPHRRGLANDLYRPKTYDLT